MTSRGTTVPASVEVLRENGPLDVREITRLTSIKMGFGSMMYLDVFSVLEGSPEVEKVDEADDYREQVWRARDVQ